MSWRSREELAHQVVTLKAQGMASRAIARALGVSRNTVKSLLIGHAAARETGHAALAPQPARAPRPQKLDAFRPKIAELIARFADITAQRVFEILRAEGFDGSYTAIKNLMRVVRPPNKPAPSLTTPLYGPGEMGESDWSPYEVKFTTGKRATVQVRERTYAVTTPSAVVQERARRVRESRPVHLEAPRDGAVGLGAGEARARDAGSLFDPGELRREIAEALERPISGTGGDVSTHVGTS